MFKTGIPVFLLMTVIIFASCSGGDDGGGPGPGNTGAGKIGDVKKFWAQNDVTGLYYQLDAELLASNTRCEIWVEKGSGVTGAAAQKVADEYLTNIYPKMMNAFGWQAAYQGSTVDTVRFADLMGDNNKKLTILLLDIKDDYVKTGDPYIAGYFHMVNFLDDASAAYNKVKSNKCDMIFMDINPGKVDTEDFYKTIAHEMQHMMNFVTAYALRWNESFTEFYPMDTWVDEGLSSAAEWVYSGKQNQSRVDWYNADPTTLIRQGDNFFLWGNYVDISPNSVLNDYATVNLFFQWLRLKAGTSNIYGDIMISDYPDYRAVTGAFTATDWTTLLGAWHAANFINSASGDYGYKNDPVLKTVKARHLDTFSAGTPTQFPLYPGEAVYTYSSAAMAVPAPAGNLMYFGLSSTTASTSSVSAGGTLLSSNMDTNLKGPGVDATVTGVKPANIQTNGGRSVQTLGSQQIGMGDRSGRRVRYQVPVDIRLSD
jgi:hypothetical protein